MKKIFNFDKSKLWLRVMICIFITAFYLLFFMNGLYNIDGKFSILRTFIVSILYIVLIISSFVKINYKIKEKNNLILNILLSLLLILFNLYILQYSFGYCVFDIKYQFLICNIAVVGILYLILYSIFNDFRYSMYSLNLISILFIISEYYVIKFRGVGMLAVDIMNVKTALNVAGGYSYELNYNVYSSILYLLFISFFVRYLKPIKLFKGKKKFIPACATIIILIVFIFGLNIGKVEKKLKVKYFKPQETFNIKGFPISFVVSIKDLFVSKPNGYSIDEVNEIMKEYSNDDKEINNKPNIIVIMDEAFTDFSSMTDLKISEDCIPFIHSLKENTIKGDFYTSIFGGGTSVTEFEVLTSNTMAFVPNGINAYSAYINSDSPSLTTTLESQGYGGLIAMHPYKPNGYSRNKVYPLLGFDRFISLGDFDENTDYLGGHVSDVGDVDRIIEEYNNFKKDNEDTPFYLFNVTMQNHSPYTEEGISSDIKLNYNLNISEANQYVNKLKYTDNAVKKIVNYFSKIDEKTIIVFFGDHEPKLEDEFYEEVLKTYNKGSEYTNLAKYNTQFFIWANYDIEEKENVKISSNYLSNLILETAGLNTTSYDKFISYVKENIPVITSKGYIGKDNKFYELDDKDSPYYDVIKKYNIIEYNNLFDKNRINKYYYLNS